MTGESCWTILGIAPTSDQRAIRMAYAARLKEIDPEADPQAYIALREAFECTAAKNEAVWQDTGGGWRRAWGAPGRRCGIRVAVQDSSWGSGSARPLRAPRPCHPRVLSSGSAGRVRATGGGEPPQPSSCSSPVG